MYRFARAAAVGLLALIGTNAQAEPVITRVMPVALPSFAGVWSRAWKQSQLFDPPESGPGPIVADPAHPRRNQTSPWVADVSNPILQPGTRAKLKDIGDKELAGVPLLKNDTLCLPLGIAAALNLFDEMEVLQTASQVVFLYARDHQVRFVKLNASHAKHGGLTWYGDSVAHYEGDVLVVDTIGMNEKTLMDRYGTPHSNELHIVERYRLSPDRKLLQVHVTFEDHIAFTVPWSVNVDYRQDSAAPDFEEIVCSENNRYSGDSANLPVPINAKPEF